MTARLESIEKMVESLSKGFKEMKASQPSQWPALQVPSVSVPPAGQAGASVGKGINILELEVGEVLT